MRFYALLLLLMATAAQGHAEVQKVIVHWRGATCDASCVAMLTQRFQQTPGVASVTVYPAAQMADLAWNPLYPFQYSMLKLAAQTVGVGMDNINVRVRGVLRFQNNQFWIVSLGDNTPFALFGPGVAQPNVISHYFSVASHPLSAELQQVLAAGVQQQRVAIIEGPLILFQTTGYNMLVVANLQFVQ